MSLKREEIAIEDEPPGLEAVGTATLHVGRTATETATGWHLAERGAAHAQGSQHRCGDSWATTKRTRARTKRRN